MQYRNNTFQHRYGGRGEISPYIPEKLKNMHFPKSFAHDCSYGPEEIIFSEILKREEILHLNNSYVCGLSSI